MPTGDFETIQHLELPETPVHVTEYRLTVYQDAEGQLYIPDCPELKGPNPDKKTKAWAETLLDRSRRLFSAWHRRDEMTAEGFIVRCSHTATASWNSFVSPRQTKEAANLAARFKTVEYREEGSDQIRTCNCSEDYFRFMFTEGVEPTNNQNEQQLRHNVMGRRITQGTRGEAGQRYHERMWTAIATCKKQNRNFFTFLHESVTAQLQNQPGPSLLRV